MYKGRNPQRRFTVDFLGEDGTSFAKVRVLSGSESSALSRAVEKFWGNKAILVKILIRRKAYQGIS